MIEVAWINTDPKIASARLRSLIPRKILMEQGLVKPGLQVVVGAKHGWDVDYVKSSGCKLIFDVCDDHFHGELRSHYMEACEKADLLTCNSETMREILLEQTGRDALIIDDPYEDDEREPTLGHGVLWFGHQSNLPDLKAVFDDIKHPISVVSNKNWNTFHKEMLACKCVVIPTGKSMAKSANRAVRAIRYGKYPVCGELPAYAEIKGLYTGDVIEGLDYYMSIDPREQVKALQNEIRDRFDPEVIAKKWMRAIHEVLQ
jgi:hypothetical protein